MNKKGFTLVEVLAVIVILGLIVGISVPAIDSILDKGINKAEQAQESEFISLAKIYATSNKSSINNLTDGTCYFLSLDDMVTIDLLTEIPKLSDKEYSTDSGVEICKKSTGIEYKYKESSSYSSIFNMPVTEVVYDDLVIPSTGKDETKIKCSSCDEIYKTNTLDEDVGTPEFNALTATGLTAIPVIYDESCDYGNGCWRKADTTKAWYDYGNQRWANAVTIKSIGSYCLKAGNPCYDQIDKHSASYYASAPANTPISFDDIYSFYVWIPRFDYKITGTYAGGTSTNPGLIDIQFNSNLNDTKTGNAKSSYYTHPAFTKEIVKSKTNIKNYKISGFWVEKFEGNGIPYVRGNIYSSLQTGLAPHAFINYLDDDMISNFEWAAIAYLSQSQYGIASGNNSSCNKKITSTYTYTASDYIVKDDGNGKVKSRTMSGLVKVDSEKCYTYDGKKISGFCSELLKSKTTVKPVDISDPTSTTRQTAYCGSTTGTIYGVYDMVGGMNEYVFLAVKNPDSGVSIGPAYYYGSNAFMGASECYSSTIESTDGTNYSKSFLYTKYNSYDLAEKTSSGYDTSCWRNSCTPIYWKVLDTKNGDALNETSRWFNNSTLSSKLFGCGDNSSRYSVNNGTSNVSLSRGSSNIFDFSITNGWHNYNSITRHTYAKTG